MADVPVTFPTGGLTVNVVAPFTDQLSVLDCPVITLSGAAVKAAIVGALPVAGAADRATLVIRNNAIVFGMLSLSAGLGKLLSSAGQST